MEYRTSEGDMLDLICFKVYEGRPGMVEAVLEANPGLAELGEVYPAGVVIRLPEAPAKARLPVVRLWD